MADETETDSIKKYWNARYDMLYYKYIDYVVRVVGVDAKSLVDVGSRGGSYVEWFDWIPKKVSIDLQKPYESERVTGVTGDFYAWEPGETFDVGLCLQVLEHVDDPTRFIRKLMSISHCSVVSVPYKWPKGSMKTHIQDPVVLKDVVDWAGREPNFFQVVEEPFKKLYSSTYRRLICVFDNENPKRRYGKSHIEKRLPANR